MKTRILQGDCRSVLPRLPAASFDCVVTDPPWPGVPRDYGRWTEPEWHDLMDGVVPECRRLLRPGGSAVFVLGPTAAAPGRMRPWAWDFLAKWARRWNVVQDAYWLVTNAPPRGKANYRGLLRESIRLCVWLGAPDCHRNQDAALWDEAAETRRLHDLAARAARTGTPSLRTAGLALFDPARRRSGVKPLNCFPAPVCREGTGHPSPTPLALARWWVRYLCPTGGAVLDPFAGCGTVPLAAGLEGCSAVGVERDARYVARARARLAVQRGGDRCAA